MSLNMLSPAVVNDRFPGASAVDIFAAAEVIDADIVDAVDWRFLPCDDDKDVVISCSVVTCSVDFVVVVEETIRGGVRGRPADTLVVVDCSVVVVVVVVVAAVPAVCKLESYQW